MHAHLLLLTGTLLLAPAFQPRSENPLAGALGLAQQASLNQVDILLELLRNLPPELRARAAESVSAAQRAHEIAVRNLIVVERGAVTADYRRWKLRRAIQALLRADTERDQVMGELILQGSPEVANLVSVARERARAETARAVSALRSLDGGSRWGGAGGRSADPAAEHLAQKDRGGRNVSKADSALPANASSACR